MKSLKKFDTSVYIQSHIETNVVKNIITVNPNAEDPDKKDITYHKAGEGKYIPIEDPEVRRILVTLIPTYDGIGFTMLDILSVTTFGTAFWNSTIRTFNEFKYFTNIGDITRAFLGSTLEEISMPPINIIFQHNNNYTDTSPFYNCTLLKRVHWGNATLSSNNEKTIENPSNKDVLTSNLYIGCENLEMWKTSLILPSTTGETMSRLFSGMKIKKFIYPDNIRYIYGNIIRNLNNFDTYIEFPEALEKINVNSFADNTNGTFHIVVKSFEPPIVENYDNLGYTNCTVNFYVHDSYYHRFMSNTGWRTLDADSHFNICKLSTLPKKYYSYGTVRTNPHLVNCFDKKYHELDILYANNEGDLQVTDQQHQLEVSTGYKPIAICIAGTDFYGEGELARWASLRAAYAGTPSNHVIDLNFTPDTGSNSLYDTEKIYSGNPTTIGSTNPDIGKLNKYCRFDINGNLEPTEGYANYGSGQTQTSKSMPMLTPNNKLNNILLGAKDKYRMTSTQGYMNTQIIITLFETYLTNWRTDSVIDNSIQPGHFPIFLAASRFHTNGTDPGDWYVGATGEVMMLAYQYIVNNLSSIIQLLDTKYGLTAIDNLYTYRSHICSDLWYNTGSDTYGFNYVSMAELGIGSGGVSDELTRCQPIIQY